MTVNVESLIVLLLAMLAGIGCPSLCRESVGLSHVLSADLSCLSTLTPCGWMSVSWVATGERCPTVALAAGAL